MSRSRAHIASKHPLELSNDDYQEYNRKQIEIMRDNSKTVQNRLKELIYAAGFTITEFSEEYG